MPADLSQKDIENNQRLARQTADFLINVVGMERLGQMVRIAKLARELEEAGIGESVHGK